MEVVCWAGWRLAAPIERVHTAIAAIESWPAIWPSVDDATRRSPATRDRGARHCVAWRGRDGRARSGEWSVTLDEPPHAIEVRVTGDLRLLVRCELRGVGDETEVVVSIAETRCPLRASVVKRRADLQELAARLARHLGCRHVELAPIEAPATWLAAARARAAPPDVQAIVDACAPDTPRPRGRLALQTLEDVLFLHWRVDPAALSAHVPAPLSVDIVDGSAWVSLVALRTTRLTDARGRDFLGWPFAQVNARTYVRLGEERGVRFLGVSCGSWRMALAASALARLPYRRARVTHSARGGEHHLDVDGFLGRIVLRWRAEVGALEHDPLAELYVSIAGPPGRLWRGEFIHAPWPLLPARVDIADNGMFAALGLSGSLDPRRPDRVAASSGVVAITPPSRRLVVPSHIG